MSQEEKLYRHGDACDLDEAGNYYIKHVCAITSENLHSKGEIAQELAYRDLHIKLLQTAINDLTWTYVNTNCDFVSNDVELLRIRKSLKDECKNINNETVDKIIDDVMKTIATNF